MKNCLFLLGILIFSLPLNAMNVAVEQVTLVLGSEKNTLEVPKQYARLLKTRRLAQLDHRNPVLVLPELSKEVAEWIISQLERAYTSDPRAIQAIKEDFKKLPFGTFLAVIKAIVNHDIQVLRPIALEIVTDIEPLMTSIISLKEKLSPYRRKDNYRFPGSLKDVETDADLESKGIQVIREHSVCKGHEDAVIAAYAIPGHRIVSGSLDGTIRIFDMLGNEQDVWRDHQDSVTGLCVTEDAIVTASSDKTIRFYDLKGTQLAQGETYGRIHTLRLTPNNQIASLDDYNLRIWDTRGNQLGYCAANRNAFSITKDNKIVAAVEGRGIKLSIWDMNSLVGLEEKRNPPAYKWLAECLGHTEFVSVVCITQDNKIVSGSADGTVRIWNTQGELINVCRHGDERGGSIQALFVTEDNLIVSGSSGGTLQIWDTAGNGIAECRGHTGTVNAICETKNKLIVSCSNDKSIRIWDRKGKLLAVCRGHEDYVNFVSVTEENRILSGSADTTVRIWDIESILN